MQLSEVKADVVRYAGAGEHYQLIAGSAVLDINCRSIVTVRDANGAPVAGVPVIDIRPDLQFERIETNGQGQAEFIYGPDSRFWPPNAGPHTIYVGEAGAPMGDQVTSLGLPEGRHCEYSLTFQWVAGGNAEEPPDPPAPAGTKVRGKGRLLGVLPFTFEGEVIS